MFAVPCTIYTTVGCDDDQRTVKMCTHIMMNRFFFFSSSIITSAEDEKKLHPNREKNRTVSTHLCWSDCIWFVCKRHYSLFSLFIFLLLFVKEYKNQLKKIRNWKCLKNNSRRWHPIAQTQKHIARCAFVSRTIQRRSFYRFLRRKYRHRRHYFTHSVTDFHLKTIFFRLMFNFIFSVFEFS